MASLGLCIEDFAADLEFELWPDNESSVKVFQSIATQWRVGPGGIYGLDYNVIPFMLEMNEVDKSEWPEIVADIRIMEDAAISQIRGNQ